MEVMEAVEEVYGVGEKIYRKSWRLMVIISIELYHNSGTVQLIIIETKGYGSETNSNG